MANAIFDGTDAVMLSQETAIGRHPVEAVAMMASIAIATERELPYGRFLTERAERGSDEAATIAFGAVGACYQLGLKALVVPTHDGRHGARDLGPPAPGPGARPVAAPRGGPALLPALGCSGRAEPGAGGHHSAARGVRGGGAAVRIRGRG